MTFLSVLITVLIVIAAIAMVLLVAYAVSSLFYNWDQRRWY